MASNPALSRISPNYLSDWVLFLRHLFGILDESNAFRDNGISFVYDLQLILFNFE